MNDIQDEAYSEAMDEINRLSEEIKRLKSVLRDAVEVLEIEVPHGNETIERMRKASK